LFLGWPRTPDAWAQAPSPVLASEARLRSSGAGAPARVVAPASRRLSRGRLALGAPSAGRRHPQGPQAWGACL